MKPSWSRIKRWGYELNSCVSSDLKPAITKSAMIITTQGMVIVKKIRLRAMLLVGKLERKMHPPAGPK